MGQRAFPVGSKTPQSTHTTARTNTNPIRVKENKIDQNKTKAASLRGSFSFTTKRKWMMK